MTIITQDGIILNFHYIRKIGMYDTEDESKKYFCLISAENEKSEEIPLALYETSDEGEYVYDRLVEAFRSGCEVFSFILDEPVALKELKENKAKSEPEKPSYKNRFIDKDR